MAIWFKEEFSLDKLTGWSAGTMAEYLDITWIEVGDKFLKATMPVDHRTKQPYGLLHGGASCVLAETLGSVASALVIDPQKSICVGLEINANHVRSVKEGFVTGIVTPIHLGASTHVWDIRIYDNREKLVCISRLTVAVLKRQPEAHP
jgi:1,4-dihydroxy-2-naphthoyl-CoA hydrolase